MNRSTRTYLVSSLSALALAFALAAPAQAQGGRVQVHVHAHAQGNAYGHYRAPVLVSGFSPASGVPGTLVTIQGSGFTRQTSVRIGGRAVPLESVTSNAITFIVPPNARGGAILVRHPRMADTQVGSFGLQLNPNPVVTALSSGSLRAGATLMVEGRGFMPGDKILLNGIELPILRMSADRILASIPAGASSGSISILRPSTNLRFDSNMLVTIALPAPAIAGMTPSFGAPGARVRLLISNLTNADSIFYGTLALPIQARGANWVEVTIPTNVIRSESFSVRGPNGGSTLNRPFSLMIPRVVTVRPPVLRTTPVLRTHVRVTAGVQARVISPSPTPVACPIAQQSVSYRVF